MLQEKRSKMDLTTRRGELLEGSAVQEHMIGNPVVNGADSVPGVYRPLENGCEMTGGELASSKKKSSFTIRNLVGGEDSDQTDDGKADGNEGECCTVPSSGDITDTF